MRLCVNCGQNVDEAAWYTLQHQVAPVTGAPNVTATVQDGFNELFQGRVEIDDNQDGLCERCFNLLSVAISMRRTSADALEHFIFTSSNPYVKNLDFPLLYDHLTTEVNTKLILQDGVDWYSVIADAPKNNVICYGSTLAIEYVNTIQEQINQFFTFCAERGNSETDSKKETETDKTNMPSENAKDSSNFSNSLPKKSVDTSNQSDKKIKTGVGTETLTDLLSNSVTDNQAPEKQSEQRKKKNQKSRKKTTKTSDDTSTKEKSRKSMNTNINKQKLDQLRSQNNSEEQGDKQAKRTECDSVKKQRLGNESVRENENKENVNTVSPNYVHTDHVNYEKNIKVNKKEENTEIHVRRSTDLDTESPVSDKIVEPRIRKSIHDSQHSTAGKETDSDDKNVVENEDLLTDTESCRVSVMEGRQLDSDSKARKTGSVVSDAECFLEIHVDDQEREDLLMDMEEGKKNERKRLVRLVGEELSDVSSADFDDELNSRYEEGEIEDEDDSIHELEYENNQDIEFESEKGDNPEIDFESDKDENQSAISSLTSCSKISLSLPDNVSILSKISKKGSNSKIGYKGDNSEISDKISNSVMLEKEDISEISINGDDFTLTDNLNSTFTSDLDDSDIFIKRRESDMDKSNYPSEMEDTYDLLDTRDDIETMEKGDNSVTDENGDSIEKIETEVRQKTLRDSTKEVNSLISNIEGSVILKNDGNKIGNNDDLVMYDKVDNQPQVTNSTSENSELVVTSERVVFAVSACKSLNQVESRENYDVENAETEMEESPSSKETSSYCLQKEPSNGKDISEKSSESNNEDQDISDEAVESRGINEEDLEPASDSGLDISKSESDSNAPQHEKRTCTTDGNISLNYQEKPTTKDTNNTVEIEATSEQSIIQSINAQVIEKVLTHGHIISHCYDEDSQQDLFSDYNTTDSVGKQDLEFTGKNNFLERNPNEKKELIHGSVPPFSVTIDKHENKRQDGRPAEMISVSIKTPGCETYLSAGCGINTNKTIVTNSEMSHDLASEPLSENTLTEKDLYDDVSESDTSICLQNESTPKKNFETNQDNNQTAEKYMEKQTHPMVKSSSDPGDNIKKLNPRRKSKSESTCFISDDEETLEKSKSAVEQYRKIIGELKLKKSSDTKLTDQSSSDHEINPISKRSSVSETIPVDTAVSGTTAAQIADALECSSQEGKSRPKLGSTEDKLARICRIMENVKSRNYSQCSKSPKGSKNVIDALTPQKTGLLTNKGSDTVSNEQDHNVVSETRTNKLSSEVNIDHLAVLSPEPRRRELLFSSPPSARKTLYVQIQDVSETLHLQHTNNVEQDSISMGSSTIDIIPIEIEHDHTEITGKKPSQKTTSEYNLDTTKVKSEHDDLSEYQKSISIDIPVAVEAHKKTKPKVKKGSKESKLPTKRRSAWSLKISIAKQPKRAKLSTRSGGVKKPSDNPVRDLDEMLDVKPDISPDIAFDHIQKSFYSTSLKKKDNIDAAATDIVDIDNQSLDLVEEYSSSSQSEYTSDNTQTLHTHLPILNSEPVVVLERIDIIDRTKCQTSEFSLISDHVTVAQQSESNDFVIDKPEVKSNESTISSNEATSKIPGNNEAMLDRQMMVVKTGEDTEQMDTDIFTESIAVEYESEQRVISNTVEDSSIAIGHRENEKDIQSRKQPAQTADVSCMQNNQSTHQMEIDVSSYNGQVLAGDRNTVEINCKQTKTLEKEANCENMGENKSYSKHQKPVNEDKVEGETSNKHKSHNNETEIHRKKKHLSKSSENKSKTQGDSKNHEESVCHKNEPRDSSKKHYVKSSEHKLENKNNSKISHMSNDNKIEQFSTSRTKDKLGKSDTNASSKDHDISSSQQTNSKTCSKHQEKTSSHEMDTKTNSKNHENSSGHKTDIKTCIKQQGKSQTSGSHKTETKADSKHHEKSSYNNKESKIEGKRHEKSSKHIPGLKTNCQKPEIVSGNKESAKSIKNNCKHKSTLSSHRTDVTAISKNHKKSTSHTTELHTNYKTHGKEEVKKAIDKSSNKHYNRSDSQNVNTLINNVGDKSNTNASTSEPESNKQHRYSEQSKQHDKPGCNEKTVKQNSHRNPDKEGYHKTESHNSTKNRDKSEEKKSVNKTNDKKSVKFGCHKPDIQNSNTNHGKYNGSNTETKTIFLQQTGNTGHNSESKGINEHDKNNDKRHPGKSHSRQHHEALQHTQCKERTSDENLSVLTKEILQNLQPIVQLEKLSGEQIKKFTKKCVGSCKRNIDETDRENMHDVGKISETSRTIVSKTSTENKHSSKVCSSSTKSAVMKMAENTSNDRSKHIHSIPEDHKLHKTSSDFQSEFEKFQLSVEKERELMRGMISSSESDNPDSETNARKEKYESSAIDSRTICTSKHGDSSRSDIYCSQALNRTTNTTQYEKSNLKTDQNKIQVNQESDIKGEKDKSRENDNKHPNETNKDKIVAVTEIEANGSKLTITEFKHSTGSSPEQVCPTTVSMLSPDLPLEMSSTNPALPLTSHNIKNDDTRSSNKSVKLLSNNIETNATVELKFNKPLVSSHLREESTTENTEANNKVQVIENNTCSHEDKSLSKEKDAVVVINNEEDEESKPPTNSLAEPADIHESLSNESSTVCYEHTFSDDDDDDLEIPKLENEAYFGSREIQSNSEFDLCNSTRLSTSTPKPPAERDGTGKKMNQSFALTNENVENWEKNAINTMDMDSEHSFTRPESTKVVKRQSRGVLIGERNIVGRRKIFAKPRGCVSRKLIETCTKQFIDTETNDTSESDDNLSYMERQKKYRILRSRQWVEEHMNTEFCVSEEESEIEKKSETQKEKQKEHLYYQRTFDGKDVKQSPEKGRRKNENDFSKIAAITWKVDRDKRELIRTSDSEDNFENIKKRSSINQLTRKHNNSTANETEKGIYKEKRLLKETKNIANRHSERTQHVTRPVLASTNLKAMSGISEHDKILQSSNQNEAKVSFSKDHVAVPQRYSGFTFDLNLSSESSCETDIDQNKISKDKGTTNDVPNSPDTISKPACAQKLEDANEFSRKNTTNSARSSSAKTEDNSVNYPGRLDASRDIHSEIKTTMTQEGKSHSRSEIQPHQKGEPLKTPGHLSTLMTKYSSVENKKMNKQDISDNYSGLEGMQRQARSIRRSMVAVVRRQNTGIIPKRFYESSEESDVTSCDESASSRYRSVNDGETSGCDKSSSEQGAHDVINAKNNIVTKQHTALYGSQSKDNGSSSDSSDRPKRGRGRPRKTDLQRTRRDHGNIFDNIDKMNVPGNHKPPTDSIKSHCKAFDKVSMNENCKSFSDACREKLGKNLVEGESKSPIALRQIQTSSQNDSAPISPQTFQTSTSPKLEPGCKIESGNTDSQTFSPNGFVIDSKLALGDSPAYVTGDIAGVKKTENPNEAISLATSNINSHENNTASNIESNSFAHDLNNDLTTTGDTVEMMVSVTGDTGYQQDSTECIQLNQSSQILEGNIAVIDMNNPIQNQVMPSDPLGLNRGIGFQSVDSGISLEYGKMSPLGTYVRKDRNVENSLSDSVFKKPAPVSQKVSINVTETYKKVENENKTSETVIVKNQTSLLEKVFGCNTRTEEMSPPKKQNVMFLNLSSRKARDMAKKRKNEEKTVQPKKPNVQFFFPKKRKFPAKISTEISPVLEAPVQELLPNDTLSKSQDDQPPAKKLRLETCVTPNGSDMISGTLNNGMLGMVNEFSYQAQSDSNTNNCILNNNISIIQEQASDIVSNQFLTGNSYHHTFQTLGTTQTDSLLQESTSLSNQPMQILQEGNIQSSTSHVTSLQSDTIADGSFQPSINDSTPILLDTMKTEQSVDQNNLLDFNYIFDVDIITDSNLYSNPSELDDKTKTLNEININSLPISTDVNMSPLQIPVSGLGMSPLYTTSLSDLNMTPTHYSSTLDVNISPPRVSAPEQTIKTNSGGSSYIDKKPANDIYIIDDDDDCETDDAVEDFEDQVSPENLLEQDKLERRRKLKSLYSASTMEKSSDINNPATQSGHQSRGTVFHNTTDISTLNKSKNLLVNVEKPPKNEIQQRTFDVNDTVPTVHQDSRVGLLHDYRPWHCALCKERCNLKKQLVRHINIVHEISQFDPRLKNYICRIDEDSSSASQKNESSDRNQHFSKGEKQVDRTVQTISADSSTDQITRVMRERTNDMEIQNESEVSVITLNEESIPSQKRNIVAQEKKIPKDVFDECWRCLLCTSSFKTKIDVIQHVRIKHKNSTSKTSYEFIPASERSKSIHENQIIRDSQSKTSHPGVQTTTAVKSFNSQTNEVTKITNHEAWVGQQANLGTDIVNKAPKVLIKRKKRVEKGKSKMKDNSDILVIMTSSNSLPECLFEVPIEPEIDLRQSLSVKWYCKLCPNWYRLRKSCHQHVHKDHNIKGNWSRFYFHNSQQVSFHPSMEICTGPHVDRNAHNFCIVCGRSYSDYNEMSRHIRRNHPYVKDHCRDKCILDKRLGRCIVVACDIFLDLHVYVVGDGSAKIVEKEFFSELFVLCTEDNGNGDFKQSDIATARQIKKVLFENGIINLDSHERMALADVGHDYNVYRISFLEDYQWDRKSQSRHDSGDVVMDVCDSDDDQTERHIVKGNDQESMESENSNQSAHSDTVNSPIVSLHRCHKCDISFPDRMSLDEHNLSHKIKIKFSCRLCFKNFPKLYFLLQHLEVKHNQSNPGYFQFVLEHEQVDEVTDNEELSPAQKELQCAISSVEASDSDDQILDGDDVETTETRMCFVCGKSMETRAVVFSHLKEKHGIYKCKCLTCNKNLSCKADLQKHFADCHDTDFVIDLTEQIFRCFVCDLILESRFELKAHMPTHDKEGYNCNLCDMKYTTASSLRFHKRTVHWNLEGTRTCKICNDKIFTTMKVYESHMIGHFYDYLGPIRCTKCDVQLKNKRLYRLHLASHSSSLVCEHCGKVFPDQPSLRHHVITHEMNENCPICDKRLNKYSLKTHIAKVHGDKKKAECPECGKFVNENYLPNHIAEMHHNTEKFDRRKRICDYCGKKFKRPGLLKSHLVVHTGDKPYECEVCGKRFGYKTALNTHYTTHKGFKPHKCHHCEESFWLIRHRLAHMKREHGYVNPDQKYPCSFCEKRFKQLAGLRLHMDEVHPEKVPGPKFYPCHVCKKEFKYRKSLREHLTVCAPNTEMGNIYGGTNRFGTSSDFREIQEEEDEELESGNIIVQNMDQRRVVPSATGTVPVNVCLPNDQQVVIHDQPEGVTYQTIYIQPGDPKSQGQVFVQDVGGQEQIILQESNQAGELIVALPENCGEYNVDFLSSGNGIVHTESDIGYAEIVVQDQ